ncbi:TPA: restriction endonuclease subunit S [Morganella morganii]|nr:restriction endonuclease subunit S [Providencia rettgeri]HCT9733245.1 restriction endonuclease subunit S [Morganella morganii]HDT3933498.1 restriction endonuclease subunit S [Morganella morganii subsp. morganii]
MSNLSYLEKLLDGVEVEWLPLKDVLVRTKGTKITAGQMKILHKDGAPLKIFAGGKTVAFVDFKDIPEKDVNREPSIIVKSRGVIEFEYYEKPFSHKNEMWSYYSDNNAIHIKFIYHFLKLHERHFQGIGCRMQMPQIATPDTDKFLVPIPCPDNPEKSLAIQSEIVRILDKFTALTAELTAELNMRKKQYNYYRDQLLSFEEGDFEWMTLGDVTKKWYSGGTPTAGKPEFYEGGNIPWLRTQEVKFSDVSETEVFITPAALKNSSAKWIPENCVIIAISGATAGRTAINKIPLTTNQHCGCLEIDDKKALYRYVFHWVSFNYENIKALGQGARGDLNSTIIKNFRLPVPYANDPEKSLAEQARIVAILDKFDTLTTSLQEGLPREIELRQKQYEYYRDLLLSFPKSDEAA